MNISKSLEPYLGKQIVIDLNAPMVALGTLLKADDYFLTLTNADLHDLRDTTVTKEIYVMDAAHNGIQPNREELLLRMECIVGLSLVPQIIQY